MFHITGNDMLERAAMKHIIAEELNIVVSTTRMLTLAKIHELERLQHQLRVLETKLS